MPQNINITVKNRIAIADANTLLICNNEDFIVTFAFDDEWSAIDQKILRVKYGNTFREVIFTGNSCIVPPPDNVDYAEIGVYGGGIVTTRAYIPCQKSIACPKEKSKIPHTAYQQLLGYYKEIIERTENVVESTEAANEAASSANTATEATNTATARALEAATNYEDSAPVIELAASGEVVVVHDSAERPLRGLTLYGKSTQDGTPTADSPIDIVSVGNAGSINIGVYGANIADTTAFTAGANQSIEVSDDGYTVIAKGGDDKTYTSSSIELPVELLKGKTVVFKADSIVNVLDSSGKGGNVQLNISTSSGTIYKAISDKNLKIVVEIPEDATAVFLSVYTNNSNTLFPTANITTVKGISVSVVDVEWETYKAVQTLAIPQTLHGIPVTSGGNYTDANGQQWISDEVDLARGVYVHRVNRLTLSPTNPKTFVGSDAYIYYPMEKYGVYGTTAYCTHFENIGFNSSGASAKFLGFATVDAFNAFLTENSVELVYVLAEPFETALSADEIAAFLALKTKFPNTTVLNDAGADMVVKYATDTQSYIDSILFVHKGGKYYCSESWNEAYRKIFKTRGTIEYIDLDNDYSTTCVSARADVGNNVMYVHVPSECGNDGKELKITYTVDGGLTAEEVPTSLFEEIESVKSGNKITIEELKAVWSQTYPESKTFAYTEQNDVSRTIVYRSSDLAASYNTGGTAIITIDNTKVKYVEVIPYLLKEGNAYKYIQREHLVSLGNSNGNLALYSPGEINDLWINPGDSAGFPLAIGNQITIKIPDDCTFICCVRFASHTGSAIIPGSNLQNDDMTLNTFVGTWAKNGGVKVTIVNDNVDKSIKYAAQTLTKEQQKQARTNLDLDWGYSILSNANIKSINHRGYGSAPENTLAAYKLSKEMGFGYVETDVRFTSDGIPVLLHDASIDRTSDGTGNISELTFEQVRAYDFGSWKSSKYTGEKIPTFEEFVTLCRNIGLHPYIELKDGGAQTQEQIDMLVNIVRNHRMLNNVTWISSNITLLQYVRNAHASARLGTVAWYVGKTHPSSAANLKNETNEVFVDADYATLTEEGLAACIEADIPLEFFGLNTAEEVLSASKYASGFSTDTVHAGNVLYESSMQD